MNAQQKAPVLCDEDPMAPRTLAVPAALGVPDGAFTASLRVGSDGLSQTVAHVSNVTYLRWIDRLAELHGESHGCSRSALAARGVMWFVARHEIDYTAETHAGEVLGCATWAVELRRTSLMRRSVIWNIESGVAVCSAISRWAYVDLSTRRPVRIDPLQVTALQLSAAREAIAPEVR